MSPVLGPPSAPAAPPRPGSSCLVVFSGGQDSTTCLHWALSRFDKVEAVFFDYGQRHAREREAAETLAARLSVPLKVFSLPFFREAGGNALVDKDRPIEAAPAVGTSSGPASGLGSGPGSAAPGARPVAPALPNTFVPGRNLVFLTCAASYGWTRGVFDLVTGVCQTDYSGYPDCRAETLASLEETLRLGLGLGLAAGPGPAEGAGSVEGQGETGDPKGDNAGTSRSLRIHAPLMHLTKAESVRLAEAEGALESLAYSHTCYEGAFPPCGKCPACLLREKGFAEAGIPDPLLLRQRKS